MNDFLFSAPLGTVFRMRVVSNSMYPSLRLNDWVVVQKHPITQVKNGDVVVFMSPNLGLDYPVVHRVVAKTGVKKIMLRTKGDNVDFVDRQKVTKANYIGVVIKKENRLLYLLQKLFF